MPVPRQLALAGSPGRPPAGAEIVEAVFGDSALDADVVDFFEGAVELGADSEEVGFLGVLGLDLG